MVLNVKMFYFQLFATTHQMMLDSYQLVSGKISAVVYLYFRLESKCNKHLVLCYVGFSSLS